MANRVCPKIVLRFLFGTSDCQTHARRAAAHGVTPSFQPRCMGACVHIVVATFGRLTTFEMVGWLTTGLYPNLIQNAFSSSSVFIGSKCFWQTTQDKLISIHGSGKGSGTRNLGQAKAPEPFARAKQKPWSHEPGSSKGSGTIWLGQAKVEGKLKGQKAGTELRTPTCD